MGDKPVEYCSDYKYLGTSINEFLGFDFSASVMADSAGRALGALITNKIKNGGFPLNAYKKLYESSVCSVSDYGGEIWGFKEYDDTKQIHLRAIRAFIGIPKRAPTPGVLAEMNWLEPRSRTQIRMIRHFKRLTKLPDHRLTKKVFLWDRTLNDSSNIKTWAHEIKEILCRNNKEYLYDSPYFCIQSTVKELQESLIEKDQTKWEVDCRKKPKLRTFVVFKEFKTETSYLFKPLSFVQRKFMAKLRLGVLSLHIETGRFLRPRLPAEERLCRGAQTPP